MESKFRKQVQVKLRNCFIIFPPIFCYGLYVFHDAGVNCCIQCLFSSENNHTNGCILSRVISPIAVTYCHVCLKTLVLGVRKHRFLKFFLLLIGLQVYCFKCCGHVSSSLHTQELQVQGKRGMALLSVKKKKAWFHVVLIFLKSKFQV